MIRSQTALHPNLPNPFRFFELTERDLANPSEELVNTLQNTFEDGSILIIRGLIPQNLNSFLEMPSAFFPDWVPPVEDIDILKTPINENHALWPFFQNSNTISQFQNLLPDFQKSWQTQHKRLFPNYSYSHEYWSWRFNEMSLGFLHLDVPPPYPEHQMRNFINLSLRPRVIQVGPSLESLIHKFYDSCQLFDFKNLNNEEFLKAIKQRLFKRLAFEDHYLPRHILWLAPGDIWISHSSLITHGIVFGEKTTCYECRIPTDQLRNHEANFHKKMERIKNNDCKTAYDFPIEGDLEITF